MHFFLKWSHTVKARNFLYGCCSSLSLRNMNRATEGNRHVRFLQVWSSLVSGEVKNIVHLIRLNLSSRLCPCSLIDHGPVFGSNERFLRSELNPFNVILLFPFSCLVCMAGQGFVRGRSRPGQGSVCGRSRVWVWQVKGFGRGRSRAFGLAGQKFWVGQVQGFSTLPRVAGQHAPCGGSHLPRVASPT